MAQRLANTALVLATSQFERRVPYWPARRLRALQEHRLRSALAHAYRTVPFYHAVLDERGLSPDDFRCEEDLARLPLIDGAFVQDHLDEFVSRPYAANGRKGFHTSGSESGLRRLVFWDDRAVMLKAARAERNRVVLNRLSGETWRRTMLREFAGQRTGWGQASLARLVGDAAGHRRLSIFPIDFATRTQRAIWSEQTLIPRRADHYEILSPHEPFEVAEQRLAEIRPRVVFSYGSYADQFLRHVADSGRPVALPRLWVYAGDMIGMQTREQARALGCTLYSAYASMEAGEIGFQCERTEGFHLNLDLVAVRVVGEDGRSLPAGEVGEIVVSNLHNRAMPLLNYSQGDRGALGGGPCPCGRTLPVLSYLEGRRSEVVTLADGRRIGQLSLEGLFRAELRWARQIQVGQSAPGELRWRIVPSARTDRDALRATMLERGRAVLGEGTQMEVEFVDAISRTGQGKFLRVTAR